MTYFLISVGVVLFFIWGILGLTLFSHLIKMERQKEAQHSFAWPFLVLYLVIIGGGFWTLWEIGFLTDPGAPAFFLFALPILMFFGLLSDGIEKWFRYNLLSLLALLFVFQVIIFITNDQSDPILRSWENISEMGSELFLMLGIPLVGLRTGSLVGKIYRVRKKEIVHRS